MTWAQDLLFSAYDPRQQEILWNEAINLQSNGQHSEAIEKLKRAAHLSRINEGLNATSQLPYLRAEIASHRALNQLAIADERQTYLSRIESTTIPRDSKGGSGWHRPDGISMHSCKTLTKELKQRPEWARHGNFVKHLMNQSPSGEHSKDLFPAFQGMVGAQYLLANYQGIGALCLGKCIATIVSMQPIKPLSGLSVLVAIGN